MVEVSFTHDSLVLNVQGTHKFWALKSRLEIPLEHIKSVVADPDPAMGWFQGLKIAGTDLPNLFRAGLFYQEGNKVFWDVRHAEKTIVIELHDESCGKLIVEVEDPQAAIQQIHAALADHLALKAAAESELEQFLREARGETLKAEEQTDQRIKSE